MLNPPDLSIIIVNWKSKDFVRKCLETVFANAKSLHFEVVVIDNASFDGCGEMIREAFPGVRFLQTRENIGFAGANNLAFRHSTGRHVLFLNPDTEIVGPALQTLPSFLQATPDAGAVGCKLLNSDLSIQTSCIQKYPTLLNQFVDAEVLRRLFPRSRVWDTKALLENDHSAAVEVISGACLMMRRDVFEQVGQFSTAYFMYAEDVDLCYRAQKAGYRNYYVSQASVVHHGGGSSESIPKSNFASVVIRESLWAFLRTHRGSWYAAAYRATTFVKAVFRVIILLAVLILTGAQFRRARLRLALEKWAKVFRWAIGLESWVKDLAHKTGPSDDLLEASPAGDAPPRAVAPLRSS